MKSTQVTLRNPVGTSAVLSNSGARLVELNVQDKQGMLTNAALGFSDSEKYEEFKDNLIGATLGRLAGRVKDSVFIRDDAGISRMVSKS